MHLPDDLMLLLNDSNVEKKLVTLATNGTTNVRSIKALHAPEPTVIVLAQIDAQLNGELLAYLSHGGLVSILCVSTKGEQLAAYQILCSVREFQTSGPLFDKFLDELRVRSIDLEGVWALEPVDIVDGVKQS